VNNSQEAPRSWLAWRGHDWIGLGARLYLGGVFVVACWHKIVHPATFALDVATYQFLPLVLLHPFALILPWVELVAGILLIVGWRVRAASLLVVGMMVSFLVALGWALHLGLDMACGCFASQAAESEDPISWGTVVRDLWWLVLALYVVVFDTDPLGIDRLTNRKGVRT
jgi:putative oxidoreductase